MAFIGNTNTTQSFAPAIDYFNGDGTTVAFTLSRPVASVAQVQAVINNVPQNPSSAFSVSGNTITFTSAPSSGTSNIYVYYTSPITQVVQPSVGTIAKLQLDIANLNGTGALQLPTGTTAERPTGVAGYIRANSTTGEPEWYDAVNAAWLPFRTGPNYSVSYLVISGGGGGGSNIGGGGGAGGYLASTANLTVGTLYSIVVGAGGAGNSSITAPGVTGSNSSLGVVASSLGGGGGSSAGTGGTATSGGSGGGGSYFFTTPASGTSGQGFAGGNCFNNLGGAGGGGAGGNTAAGIAATVNTGGGGGGGGNAAAGGNGGSGVVILSVLTTKYSGITTGSPTITTSGSNTILQFNSSGSYVA